MFLSVCKLFTLFIIRYLSFDDLGQLWTMWNYFFSISSFSSPLSSLCSLPIFFHPFTASLFSLFRPGCLYLSLVYFLEFPKLFNLFLNMILSKIFSLVNFISARPIFYFSQPTDLVFSDFCQNDLLLFVLIAFSPFGPGVCRNITLLLIMLFINTYLSFFL